MYFRVVYTPEVSKVVEKFCRFSVCTRCFGGKTEFERKPLLIFAAESCQGKLCAKWFKFSRQKT